MPKQRKYYKNHLIRYEDTIQLHFALVRGQDQPSSNLKTLWNKRSKTLDERGAIAWLTLKNYGSVFGGSPDEVEEVTLGTPAGDGWIPHEKTISIGEMLDAIDIIKFQIKVVKVCEKQGDSIHYLRRKRSTGTNIGKLFTRLSLYRVIEEGLAAINVKNPKIAYKQDDANFWSRTYDSLSALLKGPEDIPNIRDGIRQYSKLGFTAYFPKPSLILEEERTPLFEGEGGAAINPDNPMEYKLFPGKTYNSDWRSIEPIPSNLPPPPQWEFEQFFELLDRVIREEAVGKEEGWWTIGPGALHSQLRRISCFALRGDGRSLMQLKAANGMLPGVTRTDAGYIKRKGIGQQAQNQMNAVVFSRKEKAKEGGSQAPSGTSTASPVDPAFANQISQEYSETSPALMAYFTALKNWGILHLGDYTATEGEYFKAFISTTKSVAIAKCFANKAAYQTDVATYCYALLCRGGFDLPSHVVLPDPPQNYDPRSDGGLPSASEIAARIHGFAHFCEQEIAVPGAIWWENIVGMRVLRCNKDGQFFFGPIVLQDRLHEQDVEAFSALFELLSGKSQGEGPKVPDFSRGTGERLADKDSIEKSYPKCPWLSEENI